MSDKINLNDVFYDSIVEDIKSIQKDLLDNTTNFSSGKENDGMVVIIDNLLSALDTFYHQNASLPFYFFSAQLIKKNFQQMSLIAKIKKIDSKYLLREYRQIVFKKFKKE